MSFSEDVTPPKVEDEEASSAKDATLVNDTEETELPDEDVPEAHDDEDETGLADESEEGDLVPPATDEGEDEVDDGTAPDWYYDGMNSEDEEEETTAPPPPTPPPSVRSKSKQRKSKVIPKPVSKPKSKTVIVAFNPNPTCEAIDLSDARLQLQNCADEMTIVPLKIGKGETRPIAGLWKPEEDPNLKWICRPPVIKKRLKRRVPTSAENLLTQRFNERCAEAMDLLLKKLEGGFIPNSWERTCNPKFQYGVDVTPTPSTCGKHASHSSFASTLTDLDKDRIHHKTTEDLVDEVLKYLNDAKAAEQGGYTIGDKTYCPNLNLIIDEYLHEPTASYLLKTAGALDDKGNLLCTFADFYDVEHAVKSLMVSMAKECIDEYKKAPRPLTSSEKTNAVFKEGYEGKMDMRAKMAAVLREELEACCPALIERKKEEEQSRRLSRPTKIYRGSVPADVPRRGINSVTQEKYAEEIGGKILTGINRQSLFEEGDEGDGIIEILPFQDRMSFVTDEGKPAENARKKSAQAPREGGIILEDPVRAEFKSWALEHKSNICFTALDYMNPRSFREWENLKKLNDFNELLQDNKTLKAKDRKIFLHIKYGKHWMQVVRKRKLIRSYSTHEEKPEHYSPQWKGPYPAHVLANIRALKGMSNFQPKSSKSFYKGVRKLEATMFEKARLHLQNVDKEEEEPVTLNLKLKSEQFSENEAEESDELDEFEEEEEADISDEYEDQSDILMEDGNKPIVKIFEAKSKLSPTSVANSKERLTSIADLTNNDKGGSPEANNEGEETEGGHGEEDDAQDTDAEDTGAEQDEMEIDEPEPQPASDPPKTPSNATVASPTTPDNEDEV